MDGRPISLLGQGRDMILVVNQVGTLFTLRRSWQTTVLPLRAFLKATRLRLLVRLKWFGNLEVWPNPGFLVRMVLPRNWRPRRGP